MPGNSSANAGGREGKRGKERERGHYEVYVHVHVLTFLFTVSSNGKCISSQRSLYWRKRERENKREKEILILTQQLYSLSILMGVATKLKTKNYTITKYFPQYSSNPPLTSSSLSLTFWINKMEYVSIILYHVHLLHCLYGVH